MSFNFTFNPQEKFTLGEFFVNVYNVNESKEGGK
jgi:hypothetical protein